MNNPVNRKRGGASAGSAGILPAMTASARTGCFIAARSSRAALALQAGCLRSQQTRLKETMEAAFPQFLTHHRTSTRDLRPKRSTRYELAIFDFDGTLADSFGWFMGIINEVADTYRFRRIRDEELTELRSYDARRMLEHVGVPMWKMALLQRHLRKRMTNDIGQIALFPGVGELLKHLREQGITLAIVTSNSVSNVREVLGPQNTSLIQHYECGAPILGKRAKLRKVLHSSGVCSSRSIFIGDEIRDLQAARAEGLAFGAVSWGVNSAESLIEYSPEELFLTIDQLAERVAPPAFVDTTFEAQVVT